MVTGAARGLGNEFCRAFAQSGCTQLAILDLKGKSLIQRRYRDDVPDGAVWRFVPILLELEDEGKMETPCFTKDGVNFMFIRHSNLYSESRF